MIIYLEKTGVKWGELSLISDRIESGSGLGARGTSSICWRADGQTVGDLQLMNIYITDEVKCKMCLFLFKISLWTGYNINHKNKVYNPPIHLK
jgi:hypothetical protein